jgi:hypothetical protein
VSVGRTPSALSIPTPKSSSDPSPQPSPIRIPDTSTSSFKSISVSETVFNSTVSPSQSFSTSSEIPPSLADIPTLQPDLQTGLGSLHYLTPKFSGESSSNHPSKSSDTSARKKSRLDQSPAMMRSSQGGYSSLQGPHGVMSPPQSPVGTFRHKGHQPSSTSSFHNFNALKSIQNRASGGNDYKIGFVQESANSLRKKSLAELGAGIYQNYSDVSYINFLEWIRTERLTTLPHKGSRWDKVLIRALYFAEQLHKFDQAIHEYALDSSAAAAIGYGHAQLLLGVCFALVLSICMHRLTMNSLVTRILRHWTRHFRYSTDLHSHFQKSCIVRSYWQLLQRSANSCVCYTRIYFHLCLTWPYGSTRPQMVSFVLASEKNYSDDIRHDIWFC